MIPITWVGSPRWWQVGRPRPIQFLVIHNTEGSEGNTSAEAGAQYDKTRSDSVSTHIFVDTDTALREVEDQDTAYGSLYHGNSIGIQIEQCHAGVWDLNEPNYAKTFDNAAQVAAQLCIAHGIPAVHLTVAQTRDAWYAAAGSRPKGIVGHVDVTNAFPEDGGDHTDPGTTFPWSTFIQRVQTYIGGGMTDTTQTMRAGTVADAMVRNTTTVGVPPGDPYPDKDGVGDLSGWVQRNANAAGAAAAAAMKPQLDAIEAKLDQLLASGGGGVVIPGAMNLSLSGPVSLSVSGTASGSASLTGTGVPSGTPPQATNP